jgi:hypothetical protein
MICHLHVNIQLYKFVTTWKVSKHENIDTLLYFFDVNQQEHRYFQRSTCQQDALQASNCNMLREIAYHQLQLPKAHYAVVN